jgi:ferredoxin
MKGVEIQWPDGRLSNCQAGTNWLLAASQAGVAIPTGCMGGSCGACEIEVNGQLVRACIASVPAKTSLRVELVSDPYW